MQNTTLNILITVDKTYEKVLRLKITTKMKVENFHSYNKTVIYYNIIQLLTSISVDMRIYLPLKARLVQFSLGASFDIIISNKRC